MAWEKLVEIAEDQARSSAALVEIQRDTNARLANIEKSTALMATVLGREDEGRKIAVDQVKNHIGLVMVAPMVLALTAIIALIAALVK